MGRFLKQVEMASVRHAQDIRNSKIKRGAIDVSDEIREVVSVCGCGAKGCVGISGIKSGKNLYPGYEYKVGYF